MTTMLLGIISCQDTAEAEHIGINLLKKKLAACTQVVKGVESAFLWPPGTSRIDYAQEVLLLVKTVESKWKKLEKEVTKTHSYKNPEIIAVPVSRVNNTYLDWITKKLT